MDVLEFRTCLWSVMDSIKKSIELFMKPLLDDAGLNRMQAGILFILHEQKGSNVGNLCSILELNQGNVSTMCKRLEKMEYLTRSRCARDERIVNLNLTQKGEKVVISIRTKIENAFDPIAKDIGPDKFDVIIHGLEEFKSLVNKMTQCRRS